jgi:small subunit ribosomal protein S4
MNIPSYHVKDGDVVEFCAKSREIPMIFEASESLERAVPEYITADHNKMTATFLRAPGLADVPYATKMEPNLVIEFYSR